MKSTEPEAPKVGLEAIVGPEPEMAVWVDGEPENIEAAAADAYEWLMYFRERAKNVLVLEHGKDQRLDRCIVSLRRFMWPNASLTRGEAVALKR